MASLRILNIILKRFQSCLIHILANRAHVRGQAEIEQKSVNIFVQSDANFVPKKTRGVMGLVLIKHYSSLSYGPRHDATCLQCFLESKTQTRLLSYRD